MVCASAEHLSICYSSSFHVLLKTFDRGGLAFNMKLLVTLSGLFAVSSILVSALPNRMVSHLQAIKRAVSNAH